MTGRSDFKQLSLSLHTLFPPCAIVCMRCPSDDNSLSIPSCQLDVFEQKGLAASMSLFFSLSLTSNKLPSSSMPGCYWFSIVFHLNGRFIDDEF